jgi:hypothetical protein
MEMYENCQGVHLKQKALVRSMYYPTKKRKYFLKYGRRGDKVDLKEALEATLTLTSSKVRERLSYLSVCECAYLMGGYLWVVKTLGQ